MDFGNDPLISAKYEAIHARAAQALRPRSKLGIESLSDRRAWSKMSLASLKNMLVTPEMCVAAGMRWKTMCAKWGADELIDFGFRWPTMLAAGFSGAHLQCLSPAQLARLGVNAHRALECRPSVANIVALNLTASQLRQAGWTTELLRSIGLNMKSMVDFGYPLQAWMDHFAVTDLATYGFSSRAACANAGWRQSDIDLAFRAAAAPPAPPGPKKPFVIQL